jgi:hypothetical protein
MTSTACTEAWCIDTSLIIANAELKYLGCLSRRKSKNFALLEVKTGGAGMSRNHAEDIADWGGADAI